MYRWADWFELGFASATAGVKLPKQGAASSAGAARASRLRAVRRGEEPVGEAPVQNTVCDAAQRVGRQADELEVTLPGDVRFGSPDEDSSRPGWVVVELEQEVADVNVN